MEGPSLVIAVEELAEFINQKPLAVSGSAKLHFSRIAKKKFIGVESWGKHLILSFEDISFRIHFLMFGSYRINNPRENRIPKLELIFKDSTVYFYSCAIRELSAEEFSQYDWTIDLMSPLWDDKQAIKKVKAFRESMVCDVLMDQAVFAGLGNIMKNEILFRERLNPEIRIKQLSSAKLNSLVKSCHDYSWQFYEWKRQNILKRNWLIMRKKKCPVCGGGVLKRSTGKLQRLSHWCPNCQTGSKT